ncbi:MAG: alpha/beta fold hydrolase [Actinomycetota bacterium]
MTFPRWSPVAPDHLVWVADDSGTSQAWFGDARTREQRRLTDEPLGVTRALPSGDGDAAIWWRDPIGDERGRWMVTPFDGSDPRPLFPDLPDAWAEGIGVALGAAAAAFSDTEAYRVFFSRDGEPLHLLAEAAYPLGIGREWENEWNGLSSDAGLLCIRTAEYGDITRSALRVLETRSGDPAGEQHDEGLHLRLCSWSPVPGDPRVAFIHELEGIERPGIWDLSTGERTDIVLDLPGAVDVAGWWPDGSALLVVHASEGRGQLYRIDAATGEPELLHDPSGWISGAGVRPDDEVWLRSEDGATPPTIRSIEGREVLPAGGDSPPPGRPFRSFWFPNPHGQRIHAFVATPEGAAPFPTIVMVHGGPEWAYPDAFDPWVQACVDHGYAVAMVNYRGSTGYGVSFREALRGNVGFPESEDVVACLDAVIEEGLADPARAVVEGWSWGGYIALLVAGLYPDRFAAAIGGIPTADYVACHEDANPAQQDWDVAMIGGHPDEFPEFYAERSPITYVDRIRAPILIIAGENDSACPIRQVHNFVAAVEADGGMIDTSIYPAGHAANTAEDRMRFAELELAFLHRHLPGVPPPA